MVEQKKLQGQSEINGKCVCQRCGKKMSAGSFYTYKDGSKCQLCKACLTAHIDNFDSSTFEWILEKMDVPYLPSQWNVLRDRAFAKDPYKMNGMSVIGKYLAKMKLKQWKDYGYADTEKLKEQFEQKKEDQKEVKEQYEKDLKEKLDNGKITTAEYQTLVSTEKQNKQLLQNIGDVITGDIKKDVFQAIGNANSYEEALRFAKNPFQEQAFLSSTDIPDPGADLNQEDKIYLAMKWGRLYRPSQWVALEKMYKQFMESFDIQGAARLDTLKKICKTSLKMDEAIDTGDVDSYQKLSRVYDAMMKSAKFTQAQNKEKDANSIDSAAAIVDFVEAHSGAIPKYKCDEPQDLVDQIILDLKEYNRNLIYQDKSLAQEIEKYLQDKRNAEVMKRDKQEARSKGLEDIELEDEDHVDYKEALQDMKQHDDNLDEELIEQQYKKKRINFEE